MQQYFKLFYGSKAMFSLCDLTWSELYQRKDKYKINNELC